jgi:glycerol-3-phosphate dehydrogenase (NAD(P)+)
MNFCVIGTGAWGTAFALHLVRLGHTVTLVARRLDHATKIASERENAEYLSGVALPLNLQIGYELKPALMEAEVAILASPSHGLRAWCRKVQAARDGATRLWAAISLSKGLELETHLRPLEVMVDELPGLTPITLSGPTRAEEVAIGSPTAMVLAAGKDAPDLTPLQVALSGPALRIYLSHDPVGVELGGCLKNVYAIAAGCSDGLGLGDNARAALLTRALTEMVRVGTALGAGPETFYGLGGFGDLVATCCGTWSRNREFGYRIGQGASPGELLERRKTVVEGYSTAAAFHRLCQEKAIQAPILSQVYAVLYEGLTPESAIGRLMSRDLKRE